MDYGYVCIVLRRDGLAGGGSTRPYLPCLASSHPVGQGAAFPVCFQPWGTDSSGRPLLRLTAAPYSSISVSHPWREHTRLSSGASRPMLPSPTLCADTEFSSGVYSTLSARYCSPARQLSLYPLSTPERLRGIVSFSYHRVYLLYA